MQLDLKNVRVNYSIKEVVLVVGLLSGLVGNVVRTQMVNDDLQSQVRDVRNQLQECRDKLAHYAAEQAR